MRPPLMRLAVLLAVNKGSNRVEFDGRCGAENDRAYYFSRELIAGGLR